MWKAPSTLKHTAIAQEIAKAGVSKDDTVLLYCQSGRRSGIALDTLKGLGFSKAENVGGIDVARKNPGQKVKQGTRMAAVTLTGLAPLVSPATKVLILGSFSRCALAASARVLRSPAKPVLENFASHLAL